MANQLKMARIQDIQRLRARGWSYRRISRELGVHRETVARHLRLAAAGPDGLRGSCEIQNRPNLPAGSDDQNRPNPPAGTSGPASLCEPFRELIIKSLNQGLSAQRIWQDLKQDHGFVGGYDCVKRFARRLNATTPLPFRRMECAPGQEAQVDFGRGAPVITADGKRRKTYAFRIVLSHSRKAYSEVVYHQTTEAFITCLENAFWHFGGVPRTLVIDNLKAAVTKADWYDPELNPKIQSFCEHYGTVLLPTKPYMPRHKGKVERGVDYLQENALKGKRFASLEEQNRYLRDWEAQVADTRIHGTTRRQVKQAFEQVERAALLALPLERFPFFHEGRRVVSRDGHVEVAKAYYSVPPEYLGRRVWVRWDSRRVRIFNQRFEQISLHLKHEAGRFSTDSRHIAPQKRGGVERGTAHLLRKINRIGPHSARWAEQLIHRRGIEGVRVLLGLLNLANRHSYADIEQACDIALTHGAFRMRTLRELIKRQGARQEQFEFIEEHPIIRSLSDYEELVQSSFTKEHYHE